MTGYTQTPQRGEGRKQKSETQTSETSWLKWGLGAMASAVVGAVGALAYVGWETDKKDRTIDNTFIDIPIRITQTRSASAAGGIKFSVSAKPRDE
jgi:hypothetical protein